MPVRPPPPLSEADYEAIEAAVMETSRGRWFLGEYARRNRQADTRMLLGALDRLGRAVIGRDAAPLAEMRASLADMSRAIARTMAGFEATETERGPGFASAKRMGLRGVPAAIEAATSDILAAAEHVQDVSWALRERETNTRHCDALDACAAEIVTACAQHDAAAGDVRNLVGLLRLLEGRIEAMRAMTDREPSSDTGQFELDFAARRAAAEPIAVASPPLAPLYEPGDPLAALKALTPEETLALFS